MGLALRFFSAILLLTLLYVAMQVSGSPRRWSLKCDKDDLLFTQTKTGDLVHGKPTFMVQVLNACPCVQEQIKLDCHGFHTIVKPLPVTLRQVGDTCILANGSLIPPFFGANFFYTWDNEFTFKPLSSKITCPK